MESLTMRVWATALSFLLFLVPVGASALGLENIEVDSALNEPLEARVGLRSLQEGDLEGMEVNLGTAEQFRRAGIDRPFLLSRLNFEVVDRGGGQGHIRVTTKNPVVEPFLNFLLEVTWPRGRVVREYTLLLDPPVYGAAIASAAKESAAARRAEASAPPPVPEAPTAPSATEAPPTRAPAEPPTTVASPAAPAPEPVAPAFEPEPEPAGPAVAAAEPTPEPATSVARTPSPLPEELAPGAYEVQRGDTLWSLATRYRPDESVSINRMMLAMLSANPEAFSIPNVNALRAGAVLRIPDRGEIGGEPREEILAEVNRQHGLWDEYRGNLGMSVAEAPQGTMVEGTPGEAAPGADEPAGATAESSPETAGGAEASGAAPAEPDRLELASAGDATAGAGTASSDAEGAAQLRQELTLAEEESDARRREAEELSDKLREAEEIIEQQTRLLELRDDNIAALQDMLAKAEAEAEKLREAAEEAAAAAGTGVEPPAEGRPEEPAPETPETGAQPAEPEAGAIAPPETEPPAQETEPATPPETETAGQAPEPAQPAEPEAVEPAEPEQPESTAVATAESEPPQQPAQQQGRDIPVPPPPPPPSFLETVLDSLPVDPVLLGAGVGGLLVVLGGAALWRRRRGGEEGESLDELEEALTDEERAILAQYGDGAEPAMEEPEPGAGPPPAPEPSEETADDDELSSTLISAPGAADEASGGGGEEDPLTEVNVYLAYERYDQAEELVRSAIQQYPDRHEYKLRLLEVFYAAKDTASFETAARELRDAVGDGSPLLAEAQKMWQDMSPGRGLFESAESTVPEDQDVAFDITGPEGQGDTTIPIGTTEGLDESSSVDFDLGFEGAAAAGGETGSEDSSVDFDLGFEQEEENTAPSSEAGLDFDLGGGEGQEEGATGGGSSSLDFDLTEIDSSDQGGDADTPLVERAAGGDDLDFDMGDFEERTLVDSQGPPRFGEPEAEPAGGEQGGDLDFDLDSLEGESSAGADTGSASVDADVTALDFDLGAAADAGGPAEETTASQSSGLDLDFDAGEEADREPEKASAEGFDIGGEGLEASSGGAASMDEELDFGLNLDEAGGDQEAVSGKSSLDLALSLDEDEGGGAQGEDAMGLDFSLEDSGEGPSETGEDAFDTVKIQRGEGAEADSELPELDMDFDLDAQRGSPEAEGEGVDTDFEGIFDAGAADEQAGGAKGGDDEDEMALSMDLADLAPAPTPEKDMSTDLPDIDMDFESGQEEPAQDEYEATQFMLRDVPSSTTSEEPESDDEGRTLMLGGGLTGEVDEIQTKLDLAQAYIDMGDNDGAKGILDEVIAEGNDAQKQAAMGLIDKLTDS